MSNTGALLMAKKDIIKIFQKLDKNNDNDLIVIDNGFCLVGKKEDGSSFDASKIVAESLADFAKSIINANSDKTKNHIDITDVAFHDLYVVAKQVFMKYNVEKSNIDLILRSNDYVNNKDRSDYIDSSVEAEYRVGEGED